MSMMMSFLEQNKLEAKKVLKIYDDLVKRKGKEKASKNFVTWYANQMKATAAPSIEEGLKSRSDKVLWENFNKIAFQVKQYYELKKNQANHLYDLQNQLEDEKEKEGITPEQKAINIKEAQDQIKQYKKEIDSNKGAAKKEKEKIKFYLKALNDISDDKKHCLMTRVLASKCLLDIDPKDCLDWCIMHYNDKTALLAYHAVWLSRGYGGPPTDMIKSMRHRRVCFKHLAWSAIFLGDPEYIKTVLSINGKVAELKVYKNALKAARGNKKATNEVIKYIAKIQDKIANNLVEGDLNVYGPVPLVLLIQALAQNPNVKQRINAQKEIFHSGRVWKNNIFGRVSQLNPDGILMGFFAYVVYHHVTKEEQVLLNTWLTKNSQHAIATDVVKAVIDKKVK